MDCQYCARLNEVDLRSAFETQKPIYLERLEMTEPWRKLSETQWTCTFFCDACGATTNLVIELKGEPDPADWWKG